MLWEVSDSNNSLFDEYYTGPGIFTYRVNLFHSKLNDFQFAGNFVIPYKCSGLILYSRQIGLQAIGKPLASLS